MPNPSFRLSDDLYARMKEAADAQNITLSVLVREAVAHWLSNNGNPSHAVAHETVELLKIQLQAKDEQISQLHQLLGIAQKNVGDISQQLDRAHVQIEDHRERRGWWFWRKK